MLNAHFTARCCRPDVRAVALSVPRAPMASRLTVAILPKKVALRVLYAVCRCGAPARSPAPAAARSVTGSAWSSLQARAMCSTAPRTVACRCSLAPSRTLLANRPTIVAALTPAHKLHIHALLFSHTVVLRASPIQTVVSALFIEQSQHNTNVWNSKKQRHALSAQSGKTSGTVAARRATRCTSEKHTRETRSK